MDLCLMSDAQRHSGVEDVARRSMRASYALSPDQIDTVVGEEFTGDALSEKVERSAVVLLLARRDDEVVGFAEGVFGANGAEIRWLHVDPQTRGSGIGTRLFERLREEFTEQDADDIRASVLAENLEGSAFFERFGFERVAGSAVEFGAEELAAEVYAPDDERAAEYDAPEEPPEATRTDDGAEVHIDGNESLPGITAQFWAAFVSDERAELFGYYCGNCGTVTTAVDQQERIQCPECGNTHRPPDWDASYL